MQKMARASGMFGIDCTS